MALQPDATFGPYRIVRKLGEGGMGTVWEGVHERLLKRVAIKTLHPAVSTNPEAVARFMREGQAAARLHHAHVVGVTDVGVYDETPVLVMELLEGESLAARIARDGPLDASTLVDLALPVMDALAAAHAEGIIHRDLKPENIFLKKIRGKGLHPVLLDFGISKIDGGDAKLTKTASFMGTPNYMSPEQARGSKNVEPRSDQYSLGLVLYEAATGKRAVEGDSVFELAHKIATGDVPKLADAEAVLPPALCAAVDRMLSLRPADRFATLSDAGAALLPLASARTTAVWSAAFGGEAGSMRPPPPPPSTATPRGPDTSTPYATSTKSRTRSGVRLGFLGAAVVIATVAIASVVLDTAPAAPTSVVPPAAPTSASEATALEVPAPEIELARGLDMPAEPLDVPDSGTPDPAAPAILEAANAPPSTRVHVVPATPTRGQIHDAVERIAPIARACGRIMHGQVMVSFTVRGATGHVSEIEVAGPRPSPALEQCVTRAFASAQFHTFTQPTFRVRYPLAI